jgi:hypothetical protein
LRAVGYASSPDASNSAGHDLNRDNFEPNINSVGTPPKQPRAEWRTPYTLPPAPAPQRSDRTPARATGRANSHRGRVVPAEHD